MTAYDYRLAAREALKGFWVISMMIALVAALLGGVEMGSSSNANGRGNNSHGIEEGFKAFRNGEGRVDGFRNKGNFEIPNAVGVAALVLGTVLGTGILIVIIIQLIVGSVVELGYNLYNIKLIKGDESRGLGTLFEYKNYFGSALGLRLLMGLYILLWTLLFIIPGIVAAYNYAMATYIMAENPDISPSMALERSKQMMNGRKWELFCLHLSFIGWEILAALTMGIGKIALVPYQKAAEAAFYINNEGRNEARVEG